ncbi:MAG: hypothetical protein IJ092_05710, partial [Atopobiaceae bacterium]|nr:hypothetical protein [Atopobiaceae bacterium]
MVPLSEDGENLMGFGATGVRMEEVPRERPGVSYHGRAPETGNLRTLGTSGDGAGVVPKQIAFSVGIE